MKTTIVIIVSMLSSTLTFAAVSLIDTNLRNGSFESGASDPWLGGDAQVLEDPAFASDGSRYAIFQGMTGTGHTRKGVSQFFSTSPTNGRVFLLTFDARMGANGFDSLDSDFFARSSNGVFTDAIETPVNFPSLTSSEWRTYQVQYQLPESWDGDGVVSLGILFSKSGATPSVTYVGYLDSVRLQVMAEPLPNLSIIRANESVTLRWSGSATNYLLEGASSASTGTIWQTVTNSLMWTGGVFSVTLNAQDASRFFRLKSTP